MTLLTLVVIGMNIGCEDRIDSPMVNTPEGEPMTVTLNVDLADEVDGASLYPNASTKADKGEAFSTQLLPTARTKANEKPTSLYNLEIRQYNYITGAYIGGKSFGATTDIGSSLTLTLTASEQCRLVFIARGEGNTVKELGNKSFSEVQSVLADTAIINSISTDGTNMNKMPYILYLPNVKIADNKIQSPNGTDVRLRLKRLATKLTLSWNVGTDFAINYTLKEVRLFQVPATYRILPEPETTEWGEVYPSSVSEFIDGFRLKGTELAAANGSKTIWMPANAQGSSSKIAYPNLRTKENVNPATTYAEFVVDNATRKERLYYRAYLGGNQTTDFNLLENTDYHWTININNANYSSDNRISLLDQTPVISTNLQPTANCFMMRPGTNICFNPYKHTSGTNGWNDHLISSGTIIQNRNITSVKVLWQTKDAGTGGELVMGYVIDENHHENLVNLTDETNKDKARIHVKVPVTQGGNAVIAAYHDNTIVWSWHLWITDYVPQAITSSINYQKAQENTANGSVHLYASDIFSSDCKNKVMMDRHLCATAGGFPDKNASIMEFGKRIGYTYCWGRKDPFFGSIDGTNNEIDVIYNGDGEGIGIDLVDINDVPKTNGNTVEWTIEHPLSFIGGTRAWYNGNEDTNAFIPLFDNKGNKTLYDPCPDGWKIPVVDVFRGCSITNTLWFNNNGEFVVDGGTAHSKGGRLYNISGNSGLPTSIDIHNTAWFPATAFRGHATGKLERAGNGLIGSRTTSRDYHSQFGYGYRSQYLVITTGSIGISVGFGYISDTLPFRCIQE